MKKYVAVFAIASVVASMCGAVSAQIPATRPPNPNITPLGPQPHRPPGDHQVMTGTIYGFVYWDSQLTSHLPSSVCNAFSVTVAVASKGPYGPFGAMGTQSHFTPMATAHPPLTSVNTTSYDGCAYEYDNAPLGQNLYVKLNLTQPLGTLMPATVMQNPAVGPVQFSNAPCSKLPPLTKATVADLTGKWGTCQNVAYDVNLPLVIRQSLTILSSSGGMGGSQGSQSGPLLNQTRPAGMLSNPPQSTNTGSSPANGMLLPAGTPAPAQTLLTSQPGIAPGSAQKVQLNPQPLPPKGDTGPSQTMSAVPKLDPNKLRVNPQVRNPSLAASTLLRSLQLQKQAADLQAKQVLSSPGGSRLANAPASRPVLIGGTNPSPGTALVPTRVPSTCTTQISSVSQQASNLSRTANPVNSPVVFTPNPTYNHYTITGCGFGTTPGQVFLTAPPNGFPAHGGKILLNPTNGPGWGNQWSDTFIDAQVDPTVVGEFDQNNVTLVIQPSSGSPIQSGGFSFYANRGAPIPINAVPQGDWSVYFDPAGALPDIGDAWNSPVSTNQCWCAPPAGWLAMVYHFNAGAPWTDKFTFNFAPGFVISSAAPYEWGGLWGSEAVVSNNQVQIKGMVPQLRGSYVLTLWVVGPAGISNPWPIAMPQRQRVTLP